MDITREAILEIAKLAKSSNPPLTVEGSKIPVFVVPEGHKPIAMPDLVYNDHNMAPERAKGTITVLDPASFCEYYTLFSDENSRVFADEQRQIVTAIIDYHAKGSGNSPRWCQHRVQLTLRQSEEWQRWNGTNNKKLGQQDFAEFIEQNGVDISDPAPAGMMEVARDLQANTEVEFGAGVRLNDGQVHFKYTEKTKSTVGGGQLAVPESFTLSMPVFIGGPRVSLLALLRFRVSQGGLTLWYTLVRPEEALRSAFLKARQEIADTLTLTIINGSPAN
jgi:uncharacterized protein YfdQ (DUF2303 family)